MPAIDQCASQIIRVLQDAGWNVTHSPFAIKIEKSRTGYIFADLRLEHGQTEETVFVVEIKCFQSTRTVLEEFYQAIGQYVVYRSALRSSQIRLPIYLALPLRIYESFFQRALIKSVLNEIEMNLVVIDLQKEEVSQWITSSG